MRLEKDSLGEKEIPDDSYYGIHTSRSLENFNVAEEIFPLDIIHAVTKLKIACARANHALGSLDKEKASAIEKAAGKILSGNLNSQFSIDIFQSGSGTSSNMNVNEVIANLACEILGGKKGDKYLVHPNDHVNMGQSTNNIIPSAIRMVAYEKSSRLVEATNFFMSALENKSSEFSNILKCSRTHLQDAVPMTLGQEFGAYARAIEKDIARLKEAWQNLLELGIGGNAIGTGINTKKGFRHEIMKSLKDITGTEFQIPKDSIEITQFHTDIAHLSAAITLLSMDISKIANDLRLLASGPNTAIGEIILPAVEPGSSIMPGKINPSICEAANMACIQVMGYDHALSIACSAGQLELNTHLPLIGSNIIKMLNVMRRCCIMLSEKCILGIQANEEVCRKNFESSGALATVLNPKLGYDKVAELVKESLKTKKTLRQLVLEKKLMEEPEFEALIRSSIGPNL